MQPPAAQTNSDEPCDICGDVGFYELIATCIKCKTAREHLYCMPVNVPKSLEDWSCEICLSSNFVLPEDCRNKHQVRRMIFSSFGKDCHDGVRSGNPRSGVNLYSKRQKAIETGKVKFLPTEEALRLSSGASKSGIPSQTNFSWKPSSHLMSSLQKTSVASRMASPKSSSLPIKEKPPGHRGEQSMINKQAPQALEKGKGKMALSADRKMVVCEKPPRNDLIPAKEVESFSTKVAKIANWTSYTPLPLAHSSPIVNSDGNFQAITEGKNSDVEERGLQNVSPKSELYSLNFPAQHINWRGGFLFTSLAGKFYDGFQAQPKCTVSRKVIAISQRMPNILQVTLLPQRQVLEELFQNDGPYLNDIALYFFPADNIARSKETTARLLELMEANDSMMRSCIDDVELLIFTSKLLVVDSQRYFWGIFRPIKNEDS